MVFDSLISISSIERDRVMWRMGVGGECGGMNSMNYMGQVNSTGNGLKE